MNYTHEWIANNVLITYFGIITKDDIVASVNQIVGDSRFDDSKFQIADFSNVEEMQLEPGAIEVLSTLDKTSSQWNENMKIANVSTDPEVISKIEDYNKHMADSTWKTKMFSNLKDALHWGYRK